MAVVRKEKYIGLMAYDCFGPFDGPDYERLRASSSSSSSPSQSTEWLNETFGHMLLPIVVDKPWFIDNIVIRAEGIPVCNLRSSSSRWSSSSSEGAGIGEDVPGEGEQIGFFWVDDCQTILEAIENGQMVTNWVDLCQLTPSCYHEMTIYDKPIGVPRLMDMPPPLVGGAPLFWQNAKNEIPEGGLLACVLTGRPVAARSSSSSTSPPLSDWETALEDLRIGVRWRDIRIHP